MEFKRKNTTCAIVGFAQISRPYAPWNNPNIDLFGLNEEAAYTEENMKARMGDKYTPSMGYWKQDEDKIAGWFQLHPRSLCMREGNQSDPDHPRWLQAKHPYPIFMQEKYKDIPSSIKFPYEKLTKKYGKYFESSIAYILVWAAEEGYKRIELYGFEMASETEYVTQRANFCYWAGRLRASGIEIFTPPISKLLTGVPYGFDDDLLGLRQDIEMYAYETQQEQLKVLAEIDHGRGKVEMLQTLQSTYPELLPKLKREVEALSVKEAKANLLQGRIEGLNKGKHAFDVYYNLQMESQYYTPAQEGSTSNG